MKNADVFKVFYIPAFLMYLSRYLTITVIPLFVVRVLKESETTAGMALSMIGLGKVLMDLPAGLLIERLGCVSLMLKSGLIMAISCLLTMASSIHLVFLMVGLLVYGMGMSLMHVSWQELLNSKVPSDQRGNVSAHIGGVARLTFIISPLTGAALYSSGGFTLVTLSQALLAAAAVIPIMTWVHDEITNDVRSNMSFKEVVIEHARPITTCGSLILGLQIMRESRRLALPLIALRLGWSLYQISMLLTFSYCFDLAFYPVAAKLYSTKGVKYAAVCSVVIFAISMFFTAAGIDASPLLWVSAAVSGIANGVAAGIGLVIGAEICSSNGGPKFASIWRLIMDASEFIGPLVSGILLNIFPLPFAFAFMMCFGFAGLAAYLGDYVVEINFLKKTNANTIFGQQSTHPSDFSKESEKVNI